MKKLSVIMVILFFVFCAFQLAEADDIMESPQAQKFKAGVLDLADATVEIPGTIMRTSEEKGIIYGLTVGTVQGVLNTVKRALAGTWEVATFAIPIPKDYEPVSTEPPKFLNKE